MPSTRSRRRRLWRPRRAWRSPSRVCRRRAWRSPSRMRRGRPPPPSGCTLFLPPGPEPQALPFRGPPTGPRASPLSGRAYPQLRPRLLRCPGLPSRPLPSRPLPPRRGPSRSQPGRPLAGRGQTRMRVPASTPRPRLTRRVPRPRRTTPLPVARRSSLSPIDPSGSARILSRRRRRASRTDRAPGLPDTGSLDGGNTADGGHRRPGRDAKRGPAPKSRASIRVTVR
jgi:hypothetical protein